MVVTHVCEYEWKYSKNRRTQLFRWQCGVEDGETKRVQMYIDEDPGNRLLNKSKTILIRIPSVTLVFLYFYLIKIHNSQHI